MTTPAAGTAETPAADHPTAGTPIAGTPTAAARSGQHPDLGPALQLLTAARRVLVLAHRHPDADALGSALALRTALRQRGARAWVSFDHPDRVPTPLLTLPGADTVLTRQRWFAEHPLEDDPEPPDLVVTVDCGAAERVSGFAALLDGRCPVLVIDHHASNRGFGDVDLIDLTADATTVVVDRLLEALGVPLDEDLAQLLYAGLATDTGSFRRASPDGLARAARYLAAGVDGDATVRALSDSHPFGFLQALSRTLARAVLDPQAAGGRGLVHTCVTLEDVDGCRPEDAESVVDVIRTAEEAAVAAVFKQQGEDLWQVSLRGRDDVTVAEAACSFGGGGHALAAGYTWRGSYPDGIAALRAALA